MSDRDKIYAAMALIREVQERKCEATHSKPKVNDNLQTCVPENCGMAGNAQYKYFKCRFCIATEALLDLTRAGVLDDD